MSGSFATPFFDSDADNSAQTIKASGGLLYFLEVHNPNAEDAWLQLFDHAAPVVGTTVPTLSFKVPGGGGMDKMFTVAVEFATAIKYACTSTPTGAGDPTVGLTLNAAYG